MKTMKTADTYTADTVREIEAIIELATKMKNAYFWDPPCHANERRSYEARHSAAMVEWDEGGHHYTAEYTTTCSCHNIYNRGEYTRDGNKTTLTAIRNSLARMQAALAATEATAC